LLPKFQLGFKLPRGILVRVLGYNPPNPTGRNLLKSIVERT
jgi:hypothetical protein